MKAAAELLGAELFFGKVPDGDLADTPAQRRIVLEVYRRFQPSLVLAHAAGDYHADHRAAARVGGGGVVVLRLPRATRPGRPPLRGQPALWWMDTVNMSGFEPGFYIDITPHVELKRQMLACHRSQVERGGRGRFLALGRTDAAAVPGPRRAGRRGGRGGVSCPPGVEADACLVSQDPRAKGD